MDHPNNSPQRDVLAAAEEAARVCGRFLLEEFRKPKGDYDEKGPGDLVSEIDRGSQRIAKQILLGHTPDAGFLAEEDSERSESEPDLEKLIWIVDPLDGTANFLHRLPQRP